MKTFGQALKVGLVLSLVTMSSPITAFALTSTASTTVSANVAARASVTLERDSNSVTRFTATQVTFDRYDDQDPGVTQPNSGFMYAPYRSEVGKNWHLARMFSNGTTMTLTAAVTGTVGTTPLSTILQCFCGGFFEDGAAVGTPALAGTTSADWENVQGFTRTVSRPFAGITPFNYRLTVRGVRSGTYTGTITFTLTTT